MLETKSVHDKRAVYTGLWLSSSTQGLCKHSSCDKRALYSDKWALYSNQWDLYNGNKLCEWQKSRVHEIMTEHFDAAPPQTLEVWRKNPIFWRKSPIFRRKSPILWQKRPTYWRPTNRSASINTRGVTREIEGEGETERERERVCIFDARALYSAQRSLFSDKRAQRSIYSSKPPLTAVHESIEHAYIIVTFISINYFWNAACEFCHTSMSHVSRMNEPYVLEGTVGWRPKTSHDRWHGQRSFASAHTFWDMTYSDGKRLTHVPDADIQGGEDPWDALSL